MKEEEQVSKPTFQYCRFAGSFGPPIAEYVIAYIVAQERNFRLTYNEQARSNWLVEFVALAEVNFRIVGNCSSRSPHFQIRRFVVIKQLIVMIGVLNILIGNFTSFSNL